MRLLRLNSAAAFEAAAGSWMAADDHTNNLILSRLRSARFSDDVRSWLAVDGDEPQLALLETPLDLVLSGGSVSVQKGEHYVRNHSDSQKPAESRIVSPLPLGDKRDHCPKAEDHLEIAERS